MNKVIDWSGFFCTCGGVHKTESLNCSDADMIIEGLTDARNEMNYSNWHTDKFDRAIEIVQAFSDHIGLPNRFIGEGE